MPRACQHKVVEITAIGRSPEELDPPQESSGSERIDQTGICGGCDARALLADFVGGRLQRLGAARRQRDMDTFTGSAMAQARPRPLLEAQMMARRPLIPRSTVSLPYCRMIF